mmetsp:Transcript_48912/g.60129  ORF Transcript_48912/g.60129 Transcript_48912/m.60129 type:complete len:267 (+) Transcript_48912:640-1440(+)
MYWGSKFEDISRTFDDRNEYVNLKQNRNNNDNDDEMKNDDECGVFKSAEYAVINKLRIKNHVLLVSAEIDCVNKNGEYVEIKTCKWKPAFNKNDRINRRSNRYETSRNSNNHSNISEGKTEDNKDNTENKQSMGGETETNSNTNKRQHESITQSSNDNNNNNNDNSPVNSSHKNSTDNINAINNNNDNIPANPSDINDNNNDNNILSKLYGYKYWYKNIMDDINRFSFGLSKNNSLWNVKSFQGKFTQNHHRYSNQISFKTSNFSI